MRSGAQLAPIDWRSPMGPIALIRLGLKARKGVRVINEARRVVPPTDYVQEDSVTEPKAVFKGKLTYTALAVAAIVAVADRVGLPVGADEAALIVQFGAMAVAVYGKWRAARNYK